MCMAMQSTALPRTGRASIDIFWNTFTARHVYGNAVDCIATHMSCLVILQMQYLKNYTRDICVLTFQIV